MVIQHIVLYKFKAKTPKDTIQQIYNLFSELRDQIDGYDEVIYGANTSPKLDYSHEFTHGIIMKLSNREALDTYQESDGHKQIKKLQNPYAEKVLVFDIEG